MPIQPSDRCACSADFFSIHPPFFDAQQFVGIRLDHAKTRREQGGYTPA
jgi:hypothetical protein